MPDLGTVNVIEESREAIKKIKFEWASEDGGANAGKATKTTSGVYTGKILCLVTIPSGTAAPTDNYNVVISDEDGVDVLMGNGVDRDAVNTEQVVPQPQLGTSLGYVVDDKLSLSVTDAGNAKVGTVILYIR